MRSPTLALSWLTWGRHRYGLAGLALFLFGLCVLHRAQTRDFLLSQSGIAVQAISISLAFIYIVYAFSYAELGARIHASGFPAWLYTLPVRTFWLVIWPMVSGGLAIAATWVVVARWIFPADFEVPIVWPALGLAVTMAWIQAIDWSPLGGITKGIVAAVVLGGMWVSLLNGQSHDVALYVVPALWPLAVVAAVAGVSRARRGGLMGMPGLTVLSSLAAGVIPRRRSAFRGPAAGLLWWECRRNGLLLPGVVGCILLLLSFFVPSWEKRTAIDLIIQIPRFLPLLGLLAGIVLGKSDVWSRPLRLTSFAATRPVTSGDVVIAKFKMLALSLLATWLLIAATGVVWMFMAGLKDEVKNTWNDAVISHNQQELRNEPLPERPEDFDYARLTTRTASFYLSQAVAIAGLFTYTWLLMAGNLVASLSGRAWVFLGAIFFYLGAVPNFLAFNSSAQHELPELYQFVYRWLLELGVGLVVIKLALAAWATRTACRRGSLSPAGAIGIFITWCLATAVMIAFARITFLRGQETKLRDVAVGTILACPLVRLLGAPLVLDWNRRR